MTDKPSERVSARPPMPSIAPPTDDIDADWGADDDLPAPAPVPKVASPSFAPAPSPSTAPAPSPSVAPTASPSVAPSRASSPAPRIPTPIPRPSSAPRPSSPPAPGTPLVASANPLRKQTLLGMAPVVAPPSSPPAAPEPSLVAAPEPPPAPALEAVRTPLVVPAADSPLRKQTLLGIAPTLPEPPRAQTPDSVSSIEAPAVVTTDAPTTQDVEPRDAAKPVISWPPPQPASSDADEEPMPQPKRARWVLPLGIAAALGLGVGVQQLTKAPSPAETTPAPITAKPPEPPRATPKSDDDQGPSPIDDSTPDTRTPEPQPLASASAEATPSAAPAAAAAPSGDMVRIQVNSDPPGARLFWKGKAVGTTPFVLELAPGERHAYEMGLPGYNTRKVVIDGSKPEVSIGLKPEAGTFIGGNRRKP